MTTTKIKEFHLFAGIGGGIYGGELLGHHCVGGVEIDKYCQTVLKQRQKDGWMEEFDIYDDITKLDGADFKGKFHILCGGFPCQAFSYAAHGNNKEEKNLWPYMLKFANIIRKTRRSRFQNEAFRFLGLFPKRSVSFFTKFERHSDGLPIQFECRFFIAFCGEKASARIAGLAFFLYLYIVVRMGHYSLLSYVE